MEQLKMTLVKSRNYELKPFGHFDIRILNKKSYNCKMHILDAAGISSENITRMPYTPEQYDIIVNYMKKYKTDILIDSNGDCYTILGDFVKVFHNKISLFKAFLSQRDLNDYENEDELWNEFIGK